MKPLAGLRILSMIQRVARSAQELRLLTSPIKIDGERAGLAAAPALGADNASLLPRR